MANSCKVGCSEVTLLGIVPRGPAVEPENLLKLPLHPASMRISRHLLFFFAACVLLGALGHASEKRYSDAVMIGAAEYDWCHGDCGPFNRETYFYCIQVSDQVMVGSRNADWFWMYDSSQMLSFKGKHVSIRFDKDSIWMIRTDGKEMHLNRKNVEDVFVQPECTAEVHRRWLDDLAKLRPPAAVPV